MAEAAARAAAEAADEERRQAKDRAGWWPLAYQVLEYDGGGSPHVRRYALTDEQDYTPTTNPGIGLSFAATREAAPRATPIGPYGRWEQYAYLKGNSEFDADYARIRSTPAPYIGNARLMAFDFPAQAARDCFGIPTNSGFASFRMELTLSDRGANGSRDLHKWVSFARWPTAMAALPTRMLVIRAVESVRMLGVPRPEDETAPPAYVRLPPNLWRPEVDYAHPNVPHFVAMDVSADGTQGAAPNTYQAHNMYLLDATGKYNDALQLWWTKVGGINPFRSVDYSFPTTCSDPYIRTDSFTLAQEQAGRTNRMSVAELARLARPFHGRQSEYLKRYLPGNKYVQDAKRRMLEGGMLEKRAAASLLPSLAGLRV